MSPIKHVTHPLMLVFSLAGCLAAAPETEDPEAQAEAAPLALGPVCSDDADCRVVPEYCSDCSCVALGSWQPEPTCLGEPLTCVLDPCAGNIARCVQGHCVADAGELF